MTPTKTLYVTEVQKDIYAVNEDGSFLTVKDGNITSVLTQVEEKKFVVQGLDGTPLQDIVNIHTIQVSDKIETFSFGGYTFEWDNDDVSYRSSDILPEYAGTGKLVSHNFGVDEAYLCDKNNNVVWATIGGQKVYYEQSAIGQFSIANNKPQTAAEMGAPAFDQSQNVNFMLGGYVFILKSTNTYASIPVPPTND